jgi:hypothetical protein
VPVTCIRSSASVRNVGKIDACETPNRAVPVQSATADSRKRRMMARLTRQPAKSRVRIVRGFNRVEIQMPSRRPRVKEPQKAEVR